jgi:hypothetical protein
MRWHGVSRVRYGDFRGRQAPPAVAVGLAARRTVSVLLTARTSVPTSHTTRFALGCLGGRGVASGCVRQEHPTRLQKAGCGGSRTTRELRGADVGSALGAVPIPYNGTCLPRTVRGCGRRQCASFSRLPRSRICPSRVLRRRQEQLAGAWCPSSRWSVALAMSLAECA